MDKNSGLAWYDPFGWINTFNELKNFPSKMNDFNSAISGWNNDSISRQEAYNSAEAEKQRAWEEQMSNTEVQRRVEDIKAAGLNPWMALNGGSIGAASTPSGASASSNSAFAANYLTGTMYGSLIKAIVNVTTSAMSMMGSVAKAAGGK